MQRLSTTQAPYPRQRPLGRLMPTAIQLSLFICLYSAGSLFFQRTMQFNKSYLELI
jgi:hypothetical protein